MQEMARRGEQTMRVGAYAYQRLTLAADGKAHSRQAKTSNRTWEIRPSGMIGGFGKRGHGGIVNPPRNRKGETGNPPPTANASDFYPNRTRDQCIMREGPVCAMGVGTIVRARSRYHATG